MRAVSESPLLSRRPIPQLRDAGRRASADFGQILAAIALLLQITVSAFHTPLFVGLGTGASDFVNALCLTPHEANTETPAQKAPKSSDHTHAICCIWHGSAGLGLGAATALEAIAFPLSSIVFAATTQVAPPRLTGSVGARGPPERA
jgi:hypothetical protein